jgi:hypothetical protein
MEPVLNLKDKKHHKEGGEKVEIKINKDTDSGSESRLTGKSFELSWKINPRDELNSPNRLYIIVGLIFAIAVTMIFTIGEIIFSILLMVAGATALIMRRKNPHISRIKIHNHGININNQFLPYRDLKSFWVIYEPRGIKELSIQPKNWYLPVLRVPIEPGNSPLVIRNHLVEYLPEVEHPLSLVDIIIKRLGI